jgi:hypothetical protein
MPASVLSADIVAEQKTDLRHGSRLIAWTQDKSPRTKNPPYCRVGVTVKDKPELPGPNSRFALWRATLPVLLRYSHRPAREKPWPKERLASTAALRVDAPETMPIFWFVGTVVY